MRYIVEISQVQAERISSLVNKGKYQNFQQFILTAIDNQIYMERNDTISQPSMKNNGIKIFEVNHNKNGIFLPDVDIIMPGLADLSNKTGILNIPEFKDLGCAFRDGKILQEENIWLWGQVNRIFPIKLGLRALLVILNDNKAVELESFRDKAADVALSFGKMARSYERKTDKQRYEKVSAGLPIDNDSFKSYLTMKMRNKSFEEISEILKQEEFKSKSRYRAHFLAFMRKDERLDGAMAYLRFVNLKKDEKGEILIGLTEAGLKFAKLENPIIDNKDFNKSLGEKEVDFYLSHIISNVKGETIAIKWLLGKLISGITDRGKINMELKKDFGQFWEASDAVINTQRAGLMARMCELGLINKKKKGVVVTYIISDAARIFYEKINMNLGGKL